MNVKQQLATWLATRKRDYKKGVQLFTDLNIDVKMVEFFHSGNGKVQYNILLRKLENYARIHGIKPQVFVAKAPMHQRRGKLKSQEPPGAEKKQGGEAIERPLIDTNPSVRFGDLPLKYQQLFKENSTLNAEMKALHAELKQLQDTPNQERRAELARGIVDRKVQARKNWDAIDAWWKNRDNVAEPAVSPEKQAAAEALKRDKRIKANLNYIRRYKHTTKPKQKEELETRMDELDKWEVSYEELLH